MERVAKFEVVSDEMRDFLIEKIQNETNHVTPLIIQLPTRATDGSAGYDFYAPYSFTVYPHKTTMVHTFMRCKFVKPGYFLELVPKSGVALKHKIRLVNTVGIIDNDYYLSKDPGNITNEGQIIFAMETDSDLPVSFSMGSKIAQGILKPFAITVDDNVVTKKTRSGGFGSTGD